MEYANISNTNIKKLQTIQNIALRFATGCTRDANTQHLHDKTKVLPMNTHLKLYATQLKQFTQTQAHNAYLNPPRNMKATIFYNNKHNSIIISKPGVTFEKCRENHKQVHTTITLQYLSSRKNNIRIPYLMTLIHQNKRCPVRSVNRSISQFILCSSNDDKYTIK